MNSQATKQFQYEIKLSKKYFEALNQHYKDKNVNISLKKCINKTQLAAFITLPDGKAAVKLYAKNGTVWMNQNQLAELFDTSAPNISMHISNILNEWELEEISVIKNYLTTASDGKQYIVSFYSLVMILAIGFRVRSKRGTQFRIWANHNLKEFMIKGFVMDDERLKNPDGRPVYSFEKFSEIISPYFSQIDEAFNIPKADRITSRNFKVREQEISVWEKK